jgi:large subunit ribosomal protein L16
MLQPKRTKFRKMQKGRVKGLATRGHSIAFGSFALKSMEAGWITARQLEAARVAVTRAIRMGKGKGAPEYWVAVVKPGTILFEAGGVNIATAKEALALAEGKLPLKTKFTIRRDYVE